MSFLIPQPDAIGIAQTQALYLEKYGKSLTDAEAAAILGKIMRYLFLVNTPCLPEPDTPENPMTTPE
jgi:hypothetical protein